MNKSKEESEDLSVAIISLVAGVILIMGSQYILPFNSDFHDRDIGRLVVAVIFLVAGVVSIIYSANWLVDTFKLGGKR